MGARHLDFGMLSAKEGIVSDGEGPPNRITVAAPSQNVVTANITGKAAYAGLEPEKAVSAMLIAAHILMRLPLGRIDEETTANIRHMEAGLKRNIAPEDALLDGEFRSLNNEKLAYLERKFRGAFDEVASRYPEASISLDIANTYQAYQINRTDPVVATIAKALLSIGLKPVLETSGEGSNAKIFNQRAITALPVGFGVRSLHTT